MEKFKFGLVEYDVEPCIKCGNVKLQFRHYYDISSSVNCICCGYRVDTHGTCDIRLQVSLWNLEKTRLERELELTLKKADDIKKLLDK